MASEPLEIRQQKKILRTIARLKHSLAADREIEELLEQYAKLGADAVVPRLETNLSELLAES